MTTLTNTIDLRDDSTKEAYTITTVFMVSMTTWLCGRFETTV